MKKKIVFGSLFAIFLMLMIPVLPAMEYQNKQEGIDSVEETRSYDRAKEMTSSCPICMLKKMMQNGQDWNSFGLKEYIQPPNFIMCIIFGLLIFVFTIGIFTIPIAYAFYEAGKEINCW